jgi:hypothetical protein
MLTILDLLATCTTYVCEHPVATAVEGLILVAYCGLAAWTAALAKRSGRNDYIWLLYAAIAPVISLAHICWLTRRHPDT